MPTAIVTHDNGTAAVIPGNAKRRELTLQNNSDAPVYVRWHGHVSTTDANLAGIKLDANGGGVVLVGAAATKSIYAVHGSGAGISKNLTYETDTPVS